MKRLAPEFGKRMAARARRRSVATRQVQAGLRKLTRLELVLVLEELR